jgi:CRISPR system Cascade subunit CasE
MIASVLHISRADYEKIRENNKGVFDTYTLHKIVYSLFPRETTEETRSFLFAYKGGDFYEKRILLLSKNKPAEPEYGTIESKEIPPDFLSQNLYGFEVQVNPVRRDSKSGKIIPVRGKDELLKWFSDKAPSFGFEVVPDSLSVSDTDVLKFNKEGHAVVLGKAVFVGKLKVTDRQLFISTFENGLGREKAFGFGLFQIVPLTNASVGA